MPIQSFPTLLLCDGKERKRKKGRERGIHGRKKKSNYKSLKPPTSLEKGIKNIIVASFD